MVSRKLNERLSNTGPGTPAGEYFRRYWQPVALSAEVRPGGKPKQLKVLGEDLVLFRPDSSGRPDASGRDDQGRPGLLGLHCSHRLTSLGYGRVEDGGIRCPFHGWLYDVDGRCLEQPAEPEDSTFKDRIRHPAYPCQDLGGLIFAYLGPPERMPVLPRYDILVRESGKRRCQFYPISGNYLQHLEGALDTTHFSYLHQDRWSQVKAKLKAMPRPQLSFLETDYGLWQKSILPNVQAGICFLMYSHFFFPAGFVRVQEGSDGQSPLQRVHSWYVPVDDTHCLRFMVAFAPAGPEGTSYPWRDGELIHPRREEDYGRDYEHVDTICGIPTTQPGPFRAQDTMVNESQGDLVDRAQEHLAAVDQVVIAMRRMMLRAIDDVQAGRDPKHVLRDPAQNAMVCIRGPEDFETI